MAHLLNFLPGDRCPETAFALTRGLLDVGDSVSVLESTPTMSMMRRSGPCAGSPCPCNAGSFYSGNLTGPFSSTSCQVCPAAAYQPDAGQSSCIPCFDSSTSSTLGAISSDSCQCIEGAYWRYETSRMAGVANTSLFHCVECPRGAVCLGGRSQPFAATGYWAQTADPYMFLPCHSGDCNGGNLYEISNCDLDLDIGGNLYEISNCV